MGKSIGGKTEKSEPEESKAPLNSFAKKAKEVKESEPIKLVKK
jgi:hypothetical protein